LNADGSAVLFALYFQCHIAQSAHPACRRRVYLSNAILKVEKSKFDTQEM